MKFNQFANTIKPKQMHTLNKEFILIFQNLIIHSLSVYYSHRDPMHSLSFTVGQRKPLNHLSREKDSNLITFVH